MSVGHEGNKVPTIGPDRILKQKNDAILLTIFFIKFHLFNYKAFRECLQNSTSPKVYSVQPI